MKEGRVRGPRLVGRRVIVRLPRLRDVRAVIRYYDENRDHLRPWEADKPDAFYTEPYWANEVALRQRELAADLACRMFLFEAPGDRRVIGAANLSHFVRGVLQAGVLGYSLDAGSQGQGLMHEALELVLGLAFGPLNLHRVSANYMPRNVRSARVLERLGFEVEGVARQYLRIGRVWEDHVLTSKVNPDWRPRGRRAADPG